MVGGLGFDDKPARLGLGLIPYTGRVKRRLGPERSRKSDSTISRRTGRDSLHPVDSKLTLTSTNSGMVWKGAALPTRGRKPPARSAGAARPRRGGRLLIRHVSPQTFLATFRPREYHGWKEHIKASNLHTRMFSLAPFP